MRFLKVSAVMAVVVALMASSALAGPGCCSAKSASAKSDITAAFAGAGNSCSASKEKLASMISIETTELPSGTVVINYRGKTEDAVAYLQAASAGSASDFCCPLTRSVAANDKATVEIARTKDGAMVLVTAEDPAVTQKVAASYMEMASAGE